MRLCCSVLAAVVLAFTVLGLTRATVCAAEGADTATPLGAPPKAIYTLNCKLFRGEDVITESTVTFYDTSGAVVTCAGSLAAADGQSQTPRMQRLMTLMDVRPAGRPASPDPSPRGAVLAAALKQATLVRFGDIDIFVYSPLADHYEFSVSAQDTSQMNWTLSADSPGGWVQVAPEQAPPAEDLGLIRGRLLPAAELEPYAVEAPAGNS